MTTHLTPSDTRALQAASSHDPQPSTALHAAAPRAAHSPPQTLSLAALRHVAGGPQVQNNGNWPP